MKRATAETMVLTRSPGEGWLLRKLALKASRFVSYVWRVWFRVCAAPPGARGLLLARAASGACCGGLLSVTRRAYPYMLRRVIRRLAGASLNPRDDGQISGKYVFFWTWLVFYTFVFDLRIFPPSISRRRKRWCYLEVLGKSQCREKLRLRSVSYIKKLKILTSIEHNSLCMQPFWLKLTQFKDEYVSFNPCKFRKFWTESEKYNDGSDWSERYGD